MKVTLKYWTDTQNVDITLIGETDAESAMLSMLKDRPPHWYEGTTENNSIALICEPTKSKRDSG